MQVLARPERADLAPLAHNLSTSLSSWVRTRLLQRQTHRPRLLIGLFSKPLNSRTRWRLGCQRFTDVALTFR